MPFGHLVWDYTAVRDIAFDVIVPIPLPLDAMQNDGLIKRMNGNDNKFYSKKPVLCVLNRHKKRPFRHVNQNKKDLQMCKKYFLCKHRYKAAVEGKHVLLRMML